MQYHLFCHESLQMQQFSTIQCCLLGSEFMGKFLIAFILQEPAAFIMTMFCRSSHAVPKFGLWILVIFVLMYFVFVFKKPDLVMTDLRSVSSACGNVQQSLHSICGCPRSRKPMLVPLHQESSTCSDHASARGPGQKVVAYSFFGKVGSRYFEGTEINIKKVALFYPDWAMRLYTNVSLTDLDEVEVICRLWCSYFNFDFCHVHNLPAPLCDKSEIFGMIWRFFVLGDPLVDRFMIRDLDSDIYPREVFAVQDWVKSGKTWHTMRDHENHYLPMLGGMWGGRNVDLNLTLAMRKEIILKGKKWNRGYDQKLLTDIVWPYANQDMLQHDSFHCKQFNASPWPTKRVGDVFVGRDFPWGGKTYTKDKCPKSCRPKNHQDWIYC